MTHVKTTYHTLVLGALLCANSAAFSFTTQHLTDSYDYINSLRNQAGMSRFVSNTQLQQAAQAHAEYLVTHGLSGHYQSETQYPAGFTGVRPSDRIKAAGYSFFSTGENVSIDWTQSTSSKPIDIYKPVDDLMLAIYHRFGFLAFGFNEIGIGLAEGQNASSFTQRSSVYDMASPSYRVYSQTRNDNPAIVLWPPKDSTNIPPAFYTESPYPLSGIGFSDKTPVGNPVSVQFNSAKLDTPSISSFRLFEVKNGQQITNTHLLTKQNDPHSMLSSHEFALFPLKPLSWGKAYRAELDYNDGSGAKNLAWQFATRCLNLPILTIKGGETLMIPAGTQEFVIYADSTEAVAYSYGGGSHMMDDLQLSTINGNTLKVTTSGRDGRGTVSPLTLRGETTSVSFNISLSDNASLPPVSCETSGTDTKTSTDTSTDTSTSTSTATSTSTGTATSTSTSTNTARLTNISTRAFVGDGMQNEIAGFAISGSGTKNLIIRATGQGLMAAGVPTDLDAQINLVTFPTRNSVANNARWGLGNNASQLQSLNLAPGHSSDAADLLDLSAGAYTAEVSPEGTSGIGLIEVFESPNATGDSRLSNISTRAFVGSDLQNLIAGFAIAGEGKLKLVLRALGQGLTSAGVSTNLDARIQVYTYPDRTLLAQNDSWRSGSSASELESLKLAPLDSTDAALIMELGAGAYTVEVVPISTTGIGLIEVFEAP